MNSRRRSRTARSALFASILVLLSFALVPAANAATTNTLGASITSTDAPTPPVVAPTYNSLSAVPVPSGTIVEPNVNPSAPVLVLSGPDGGYVAPQATHGAKSQAQTAAPAVTCGGNIGYGPPTGTWSGTYLSNCSIFGSPGADKSYTWAVQAAVDTEGCGQGDGYYDNGINYWRSAGCGTGGSNLMKWGNVIATPEMKFLSLSVPLGVTTIWT